MTPVKPPRTKYPVKSTITGSDGLPAPSPDIVYQDLDTLKPVLKARSQSVDEITPKPLPRTKSHPETLCGTDSTVQYGVDAEMSKHNRYPADYKTPHPVRAPPEPPKRKHVISSHPTAVVNGGHTELTVKPAAGERTPSPVPPPRPERPRLSPNYYERTLPGMGVTLQGSTESSALSRRPSLCSMPQSAAPSNEVVNRDGTYDGRAPGVTASDVGRPACPPRPPRLAQFPKHSVPPAGCETSSLQGNEFSPVYDSRKPPPVPPKSQAFHRLSTSSSSTMHSYYNAPSDVLSTKPCSAKDNTRPARPPQPPPPSFTPPPTPSLKRPSYSSYSSYSTAYYNLECPYAEIEDPLYLDILPENEQIMLSPSDNVYNSYNTPRSTPSRYLPPPQQTRHDTEDINSLLRWLKTVGYSGNMAPSLYGCRIEDEAREFHQRAINVKKALLLFNLLLIKRNDALREHISALTAIADSLDKVQKKTKTMSIAGGTTGAVGGVAAVVGIALAPVTMGASLVATAIGAGMVASAGGMGAHAAIANKKTVERKTVEKIVQDYKASIVDVECCLVFICSGMDELRRHDLDRLHRAGAHPTALRMAELSQSVFRDDMGKSAAPAGGMSSERLLHVFAQDMDLYFTEKDGQRMKKSNELKFSSRIRLLVENLQEVLDQLNHKWEMFSRF